MITPTLNSDGYTGHILIEPNRPISWHDNIRFLKFFALLSFLIGVIAMYHGFFLVMPFSGLEVIILAICLYLVFKRYSTCQVIYFTPVSVVIEWGETGADKRVVYQRHWSKFHVDNKGNYNIPRLNINSKGKTTEIGAFLNFEDKLVLIDLIKTLTAKFRKQAQPD